MAHIARDLNNGEVASIRKEFKGKKTQGWHASTIQSILTNKVYLGWTMYEGKPVKRCEPSITVEAYNRI